MKIGRRTFLKLSLVVGSALGVDVATAAERESMLKRPIPGTGEQLPAVGLGTSDEFEGGAGQDLDPLREVLRRFVALGGTLIDTAPVYGDAETVIGQLLAELGIGAQVFVATKVRTRGQQAGLEQMQRSERLLGRRPLDLLQVHSLVDVGTQLDNLRRWKEAGRVRYIGITHSRVSAFDELERLMQNETLDFVQLNYSFMEPDAERRLLPLAAE
ncbi:MAG: aldo/keto reductase, partial [Gammaproteobacteria bacterium]|nr:aldo/keto reductase [Gammaproteobacteria bacterium]